MCSATFWQSIVNPPAPEVFEVVTVAVRLTLRGRSTLGTAMPSHAGPCQPSAKPGTAASEVDELPENATEVWDVPVLWIPE